MTLLSCWILITLLNFDTILSRNSTVRRYVDGSEFHVELWPGVKIPRWILTPGQNSTLNYDPGSEFHIELWSQAQVTIPRLIVNRGSQFNAEFRPRVIFQCGIKTRCNFSTWNHDPDRISTWNLDPGNNSTWNHDPGSHFNVELWPGVTIPHWIVIPIPGHNLMLNHDSGSTFNVESRPGVIIQRGIKTWGSQFNGGPNFIRWRGRNTMTPCLGGSHFNMKNPLNPEHSPLNQDPTGRNSMGSKFNPTPAPHGKECTRTRQIIWYRATATIRRRQIKQYTASKWGGCYKTNGNIIWFWKSMKRCIRRPFREIIHQGC